MKRLGLLVLAIFAVGVPSTAASPGYTIAGLKIPAGMGAFGGVPVGSCDLLTYSGCTLKTFTVKNVGTSTIRIGGFGIADLDPLIAAIGPSAPGSCDFLPVVDGYWALTPDASCQIAVALSPTERGPVRNELHIWYLDPSQPIAVVPLSAVGT
jgi:hypothetical protein